MIFSQPLFIHTMLQMKPIHDCTREAGKRTHLRVI